LIPACDQSNVGLRHKASTRSMLPAGLPRAKHKSTLVKFVLSDGLT